MRADPHRRVLILGGTTEARRLADLCAGRPGLDTVTSLAGLVAEPVRPAGELRVGGFGGPTGLARYLSDHRIDALVDASHPFAATISASARAAAATTGVPLLVLRRPGWTPTPGDDWRRVPDLAAAAGLLPGLGERVLLTTGRTSLAAFARVPRCWFLLRSVEPPTPPMPPRSRVLLARGPFDLADERALLADHRIDVVVTKDSGGPTGAKLVAARERGIPVVLVDRPPVDPGAPVVGTVDEALTWLSDRAPGYRAPGGRAPVDRGSGAAGTCP